MDKPFIYLLLSTKYAFITLHIKPYSPQKDLVVWLSSCSSSSGLLMAAEL